jgi:hypothetical protein
MVDDIDGIIIMNPFGYKVHRHLSLKHTLPESYTTPLVTHFLFPI